MIKLTLPLPPSANRYWRTTRTGHIYVSDEASAYKEQVGWEARIAGIEPLTGEVSLKVEVYPKRQSRDLDNCLKVLIDALKGYAYVDDKQIVMITAVKHRYGDCRVEVEVSPCEIH